MSGYRAITQSGASYEIKDGFWHYKGSDGEAYEKIWSFKNVEFDKMEKFTSPTQFWSYILDLPDAEKPEVGKGIYVASRDIWRRSTPVISVEEID
jgi:hypothetical protein